MNVKQLIENHPVIVFLGALCVGFISGWKAHTEIQDASGQTSIAVDRIKQLERYEVEIDQIRQQHLESANGGKPKPQQQTNLPLPITTKKSENLPRNETNITSNNQSGGITAHTVNLGQQPRTLTAKLEQQLLSRIPHGKNVTIDTVMGDQEAFQFASKIKEFLVSKSYNVSGINQFAYSQPVIGQDIIQKDDGFEIRIGGQK